MSASKRTMVQGRLLRLLVVVVLLLSAGATASCQAGKNTLPTIKADGNIAEESRVLIAYRSKYGSTKQYAEWIRQDTGGDLVDIDAGDAPDLARYDVLIFGGYVRTGNIVVAPFIREHWREMKGKEVVLFTTSGTPPGHPKMRSIYEKGLSEEIRKGITYFPLPGRISGKDLTAWDKILIAIGKVVEQDETLKKDMGKDFDGVRREQLSPLLEYVENVTKRSKSHQRGRR